MDTMICRWIKPDGEYVAWVSAGSKSYTLHHVLEDYILHGARMEILETLALPFPKPTGMLSDRCNFWRNVLNVRKP
jgi:hypothetical protein